MSDTFFGISDELIKELREVASPNEVVRAAFKISQDLEKSHVMLSSCGLDWGVFSIDQSKHQKESNKLIFNLDAGKELKLKFVHDPAKKRYEIRITNKHFSKFEIRFAEKDLE